MRRRVLVYLSPVAYASFKQRPHYMVNTLLKSEVDKVIWLQPYPTRLPEFRDFVRPTFGLPDSDTVEDSISVWSVRALPIEPLPAGSWLNSLLFWRTLLQNLKSTLSGCEVIIGVGKPSRLAIFLLRNLSCKFSFYDAMDDFPDFYHGLSRRAMANTEKQMLHLIDSVFVSATTLVKKFERMGLRCRLIPNAYDMTSVRSEASVIKTSKKIVGYLGTVGHWFDWAWVIELADCCPNIEIHIVGPIYDKCQVLMPDNIKMFPACSQEDAWKFLSYFDYGLIPFKNLPITESVDPIKYYEYRAYGIPVISTAFGEMSYRKNELNVNIVDSVQAASHVLLTNENKPAADDVGLFVRENDWSSRFVKLIPSRISL